MTHFRHFIEDEQVEAMNSCFLGAYSLLRSHPEASETVSEVFALVLESEADTEHSTASGYWYRAGVNGAKNHVRASQTRRDMEARYATEFKLDSHTTTIEEREEYRRTVLESMLLTGRQRQILLMLILGYKKAEIRDSQSISRQVFAREINAIKASLSTS